MIFEVHVRKWGPKYWELPNIARHTRDYRPNIPCPVTERMKWMDQWKSVVRQESHCLETKSNAL